MGNSTSIEEAFINTYGKEQKNNINEIRRKISTFKDIEDGCSKVYENVRNVGDLEYEIKKIECINLFHDSLTIKRDYISIQNIPPSLRNKIMYNINGIRVRYSRLYADDYIKKLFE